MSKLPLIKGRELVKFLESMGFRVTRTKGSHARLRSENGRATTVLCMEIKIYPKGFCVK
jgi:predicted RNA binding protein YcfA (HicA-like mRNA interferase family)